ncbi:MAG: TolB family protein [Ilumatobacteraceae bacterium]
MTDPTSIGAADRVDVSTIGEASNGLSDFPSLDRTGNLVAFHSTATNLDPSVPLPSSGGPNKVYLRDLAAGTTQMISVTDAEVTPPGNAVKPDMSPDGRFVAFASEQVLASVTTLATDVARDSELTYQQVYVLDRQGDSDRSNDTIAVASVGDDESLGNGPSALEYGPTVSDDGTKVAFESDATNLVELDENGETDAFLRDVAAGTTVRVSESVPFEEFGPLVPMNPVRLADTRSLFDPLGPGESMMVDVHGVAGVPATASAAALNVTAASIDSPGYLTVYPTGEPEPYSSVLNLSPGSVDANAVTAAIGTDGSVTISNFSGQTHVIVDLNGYFDGSVDVASAGGGFVPLSPVRLHDTRDGGGLPVGPGETLTVDVAGTGGVSPTANAAALNVTVDRPTAESYLTVFETGQPMPEASSLNFTSGQVVCNSVISKIGADGTISIYNAFGDVHVIVDVNGFYDPMAYHGGLTPVTPSRLLDTRSTIGPIGPAGTIDLTGVGVGGVPATGVTAVVLNVTATGATAPSYLTAFPTGTTKPYASNLNYEAGETQPCQVLVRVGEDGKVSLFNAVGAVHVVIDVMAWYSGVEVADGGHGPAVSGDGTAVAFESTSPMLTGEDTNGVKDAFLRVLANSTTERVSVAVPGGSEATGTRIDGHTGEIVPQTNGADVAVGASPNAIAFVSNGDLAADRPIGEENPGELSTEPASFMRLR